MILLRDGRPAFSPYRPPGSLPQRHTPAAGEAVEHPDVAPGGQGLASRRLVWHMLPFSWATDSYSRSAIQLFMSCRIWASRPGPCSSRPEARCTASAPGQQQLEGVVGAIHAAGGGEGHTGVARRMAIQRMRSSASPRGREVELLHHLQPVEVDVRLEEAVEQRHAVGADGLQALHEVGSDEKKGGSFITMGTPPRA